MALVDQLGSSPMFVLDANVLINFVRFYPPDIVGIRDSFRRMYEEGRFVVPYEVKEEINAWERIGDWLAVGIDAVEVWEPDDAGLRLIEEVERLFPALGPDKRRPILRADPHLLASARDFHAVVVTGEKTNTMNLAPAELRSRGHFAKSQKLDAACTYYGVPCALDVCFARYLLGRRLELVNDAYDGPR